MFVRTQVLRSALGILSKSPWVYTTRAGERATLKGVCGMRQLKALVCRFPAHELTIHRLYLQDVTFRTVCIDYEDAQRALQHWQARSTSSAHKAKQFRQIVGELEMELLGRIEASLVFNHLPVRGAALAIDLPPDRRVLVQA